jgi:hypothetical protein
MNKGFSLIDCEVYPFPTPKEVSLPMAMGRAGVGISQNQYSLS